MEGHLLVQFMLPFFGVMLNRQEVLSKNNCEHIANSFYFPIYVFSLFSNSHV